MSQRLAEVGQRIATADQLGTVVNAMRAMAGARAQQARSRLPAIRTYALTTRVAMAQARRLLPGDRPIANPGATAPPVLVVLGAEQGFAGSFPQQALDAVAASRDQAQLYLMGERSATLALEQGWSLAWQGALPTGVHGLTAAAATLADAIYAYLAREDGASVSVSYPVWEAGLGLRWLRRGLLPLDPAAYADLPATVGSGLPPLTHLAAPDLLARLTQEYFYASLCEAVVEAFAAENEARVEAMASAHLGIEDRRANLRAEERLTRQDEITAEVLELAAATR